MSCLTALGAAGAIIALGRLIDQQTELELSYLAGAAEEDLAREVQLTTVTSIK
jgi:hypothetical protein